VSTPKPLPNQQAARALGRLGYPGFAYLRSGTKVNPMEVLLGALLADDVDARVVEGLPWLLVRYPDVDWERLVAYAKQHDAQNRLGFLVALAGRLAAAKGDAAAMELLDRREQALQRSLLQQDDTFSRASLTQAERRWLAAYRWLTLPRAVAVVPPRHRCAATHLKSTAWAALWSLSITA
jgi:hypothetical protein